MSADGGRRVGRTALLLVPIALLSRGAAFVVPLAVAWWFGVGPVTDAWFWALSFPTFILVLASSALGTASLPAIAAARAERAAELPRLLGGLMSWAVLGAASFGVFVAMATPPLLERVTDFDAPTRALAASFLWSLVPFMALTCCGTVLRVSAEVVGLFGRVASTPLLRASLVIGVLWALRGPISGMALPAALLAGELGQCLYWGWLLRREGIRVSPTLQLDPGVLAVLRDLLPILGGEVLVALNLVIDKGFAALLAAGSVATLEYADRARVIPQTLLESTLLMVSFAAWSNLRAQGRADEARAEVGRALRWTVALASPVLAGLYIGRTPLIALLFERGAFTPQDTVAVASLLGWFLPGVLPNLLGILAVRAHVVERNLSLVFQLGLLSVVMNTAMDALLLRPMGLPGLALATTLTNLLIPGLYLWALRGLLPAGAWRGSASIAGASLALAVGVELSGAPTELFAPRLWLSAIACFSLLGLGWWVGRREPR